MNHRLIQHMVLIGAACLAFASVCAPARAQMIVYDPSNYAQNVLQAARALQQISNQITSLQNQTQMLLNQAKHLASFALFEPADDRAIARTHAAAAQRGAAPGL